MSILFIPRILKVDNDGTPLTTGSNSTINPTDIHYKLLELSTGIDLNGDGRNGFSIAHQLEFWIHKFSEF